MSSGGLRVSCSARQLSKPGRDRGISPALMKVSVTVAREGCSFVFSLILFLHPT